eukprot:447818-Amorphochlora_amoeboformis.AAC.1
MMLTRLIAARSRSLRRSHTVLSGGTLRRTFSSKSPLVVDNPYTLKTYCEVPQMNDKTVLGYVDASASVQASWKNVPLAERLDMVEKALDQLLV